LQNGLKRQNHTFRSDKAHPTTIFIENLKCQSAAVSSNIEKQILFGMSLNVRENYSRLILKVKINVDENVFNWSALYLIKIGPESTENKQKNLAK
jgi:hypothetical protein